LFCDSRWGSARWRRALFLAAADEQIGSRHEGGLVLTIHSTRMMRFMRFRIRELDRLYICGNVGGIWSDVEWSNISLTDERFNVSYGVEYSFIGLTATTTTGSQELGYPSRSGTMTLMFSQLLHA
jgi:hypothetical protein